MRPPVARRIPTASDDRQPPLSLSPARHGRARVVSLFVVDGSLHTPSGCAVSSLKRKEKENKKPCSAGHDGVACASGW